MELPDFIEHVKEAQSKGLYFVAFVHCTIKYSGRAEAEVPRGDRLIMIKQDGVLHIHQPVNGTPINYLKAGCSISFQKIDDHIFLNAKSYDEKEFLDIEIFRVYDVMQHRLEDGQKQILQGSEKDMSDMIRDNPSLIAPDFKPLSREEHTKVGFIDVFGHDGEGNLVIIECKRFAASLACVTQLRRYVKKMKELRGIEKVRGVMASPSITTNAMQLLKEWNYSWVQIEAPKRMERHNRGQKRLGEF